jgi:hypothetical protein
MTRLRRREHAHEATVANRRLEEGDRRLSAVVVVVVAVFVTLMSS